MCSPKQLCLFVHFESCVPFNKANVCFCYRNSMCFPKQLCLFVHVESCVFLAWPMFVSIARNQHVY